MGLPEEVVLVLPHGWTELVALLDQQGPGVDPMTRVQRLCALCAQVTGVAGVALSVGADGTRSTVCATDDLSDRIEELQDTIGEGPSVEVLRTGDSVLMGDLIASDGRWPGFTPAATDEGVRGLFVFPLRWARPAWACSLSTAPMWDRSTMNSSGMRGSWRRQPRCC